jgi:hypothetical protein
MDTLFDYLTYTKAAGYIVAAVLLVGFIRSGVLTERETATGCGRARGRRRVHETQDPGGRRGGCPRF